MSTSGNKGENIEVLKEIVDWNIERSLDQKPHSRSGANRMLIEELLEFNGIEDEAMLDSLSAQISAGPPVTEDEKVDALCDIIVIATGELLKLGYDPQLAMAETLREINSRTGAFNKESGKWEKYKTPEAQALWYTAAYGTTKRNGNG